MRAVLLMDPYIQQQLRKYKARGVKQVKAVASGRRDECEFCKERDGVIYAIDEFPEYPPRGCTCPLGCGCVVAPLEGDAGARKRELPVTLWSQGLGTLV